YGKTIITSLYVTAKTAQDLVSYGMHNVVGRNANSIVSYRWGGLDPLTGNPQGILNGQVTTNYIAIFNDSAYNQVVHGSSVPLFFGNFNNSFSWKRWRLSMKISYRLGFYFRTPSISYYSLANSWAGTADYA